jgi:hypothetical protein
MEEGGGSSRYFLNNDTVSRNEEEDTNLQEEGDEVACYESKRDGFRGDASVLRAVVNDDTGEHQVNRCSEEDRPNRYANQITFATISIGIYSAGPACNSSMCEGG